MLHKGSFVSERQCRALTPSRLHWFPAVFVGQKCPKDAGHRLCITLDPFVESSTPGVVSYTKKTIECRTPVSPFLAPAAELPSSLFVSPLLLLASFSFLRRLSAPFPASAAPSGVALWPLAPTSSGGTAGRCSASRTWSCTKSNKNRLENTYPAVALSYTVQPIPMCSQHGLSIGPGVPAHRESSHRHISCSPTVLREQRHHRPGLVDNPTAPTELPQTNAAHR